MTSKSDLMKSCGITAVVHEVVSYDSATDIISRSTYDASGQCTSVSVEYPKGVFTPMKEVSPGQWEYDGVTIPAGAEFKIGPTPKPKNWWNLNGATISPMKYIGATWMDKDGNITHDYPGLKGSRATLTPPPVRSLMDGDEIRPIDILEEVYQMFTEGRSEITSKLGAHFEARVLAAWEKYGDEYLARPNLVPVQAHKVLDAVREESEHGSYSHGSSNNATPPQQKTVNVLLLCVETLFSL